MNIYIINGKAFAEIVPNCLLLFADEEEFWESSTEDISDMIENAIAVKQIEAGKG